MLAMNSSNEWGEKTVSAEKKPLMMTNIQRLRFFSNVRQKSVCALMRSRVRVGGKKNGKRLKKKKKNNIC